MSTWNRLCEQYCTEAVASQALEHSYLTLAFPASNLGDDGITFLDDVALFVPDLIGHFGSVKYDDAMRAKID